MKLTDRDLLAFEAFRAAGKFQVPSSVSIAELDVEQAVFESLAFVLRQLEARVEDIADGSDAKTLAFVEVAVDVPVGWKPSKYPTAFIDSTTHAQLASFEPRVVTANGEDVVTDEWALWKLGEDTGEATVKVYTTTEVEAKALGTAVMEALAGNVDAWRGAGLPLSERYLPPPFRDVFAPERFPSAHLSIRDSQKPVPDAESNIWTADVTFAWSATRYTARRRIGDFRPFITQESSS